MSVSEMRGSPAAAKTPDIAEPVIGRRLAPTRWRIRATVAVPQGEQTRTRPRITSTPSQARLPTLTAAARRIRIEAIVPWQPYPASTGAVPQTRQSRFVAIILARNDCKYNTNIFLDLVEQIIYGSRQPCSSRGVFLEAILKAERGVASCGGGSQPRPGRPGTPPARH